MRLGDSIGATYRGLITGFSGFSGVDFNPTEELVNGWARRLAKTEDGLSFASDQWTWTTAVCPVAFEEAFQSVAEMVRRSDLIISFGVAAKRERIALERYYLNLRDCDPRGAIAREGDTVRSDIRGAAPVDRPIRSDGPMLIASRLDVRSLLSELSERHFDVEISVSAGTFVCNDLAYLVAADVEERRQKVGRSTGLPASLFVHVPMRPASELRPVCETIVKLAMRQLELG